MTAALEIAKACLSLIGAAFLLVFGIGLLMALTIRDKTRLSR